MNLTADRGGLKPSATVPVFGIVDSGADRSFFPMQIAARLGLILKDDLVEDQGTSRGVGSSFKTWSSTVTIRAQIVANFVTGPQTWGPQIVLTPAFGKEIDSFLLGRDDFFAPFTVTFEQQAHLFHLDF